MEPDEKTNELIYKYNGKAYTVENKNGTIYVEGVGHFSSHSYFVITGEPKERHICGSRGYGLHINDFCEACDEYKEKSDILDTLSEIISLKSQK